MPPNGTPDGVKPADDPHHENMIESINPKLLGAMKDNKMGV